MGRRRFNTESSVNALVDEHIREGLSTVKYAPNSRLCDTYTNLTRYDPSL